MFSIDSWSSYLCVCVCVCVDKAVEVVLGRCECVLKKPKCYGFLIICLPSWSYYSTNNVEECIVPGWAAKYTAKDDNERLVERENIGSGTFPFFSFSCGRAHLQLLLPLYACQTCASQLSAFYLSS